MRLPFNGQRYILYSVIIAEDNNSETQYRLNDINGTVVFDTVSESPGTKSLSIPIVKSPSDLTVLELMGKSKESTVFLSIEFNM